MYKHHEESLAIMQDYFRKQPDVIALIFGGSVAKGNERIDSDLDAMVVVPDDVYQKRVEEHRTAEAIQGMCTYEGGYFDVKYMTKGFLMEAADKASEPTRSSFIGSRVLFSDDPEIPGILARIPVFQQGEKEDKLLSFYSDFGLSYYYFIKSCRPEGYMKLHYLDEIIYSLYRIILQEHEILFPCNRRLEETVAAINEETFKLTQLGKKAAASQDVYDIDLFVDYFKSIAATKEPEDIAVMQSRYCDDFEQWWRFPRPNVNEW